MIIATGTSESSRATLTRTKVIQTEHIVAMSKKWWLALGLLAGLGASGCASSKPRGHPATSQPATRGAIAVGAEVVALVASPDGETVVSVNHPATVSLIDVAARREVARVEAQLRSSGDRLVDVAFDSRTRTAWIVSNGGEIFSLHLDSQVLRLRFRTDEPLYLTAVAWDEGRSRALVGDLEGGVHALDGDALHQIYLSDMPIAELEVHGNRLYFTAAEGGMGPTDSYFGAYDLAAGDWLFIHSFEDHTFWDVSVAGERIWVAETWNFRLLEFTVHGGQLATRYMDGETLGPDGHELGRYAGVPHFAIDQVAASHARVVIASGENSERRILEYRRAAGGFPSLPVAQYTVPGSANALCLLGEWGLAAAVGEEVLLIPTEEAQPFVWNPGQR